MKRSLLMILAALSLAALVLLVFHPDPFQGIVTFFLGPFSRLFFFGNMLNRMSLYLLSGGAIVLAFKGGEFNLGGEGQICMGGMATLALLLQFPAMSGIAGVFFAVTLSIGAGGLMGLISAILKNRYNLGEVITTYLFSMGIIQLSRYLITGPMKDSESFLITTPGISEKFHLSSLLHPSHLNLTFPLALIIILLIYLYLYGRPAGYDWRLAGINGQFAAYCGVDVKAHRRRVLFSSGALNGLAGSLLILGTAHQGILDFFSGYGWNGMAVSLIGGNHPLFVIPSALFFSLLGQGSELMAMEGKFPYPLDQFLLALVFLMVTAGRLRRD